MGKKVNLLFFLSVLMLLALLSLSTKSPVKPSKAELTNEQAFHKMMNVLTHKRCVNCHPSGDTPKQGEESRIHDFGITRNSVQCQSCHQEENNPFSGVPGAPNWTLAPASMKWEGLSRRQIAESVLDLKRNGGRTHEELIHHLTEHELVLWAWNPGKTPEGKDREPIPIPLDDYIKAVKTWFENGAVIPESAE